MIRTSLLLPATLHQQLVIAARKQGKNLSQLARELLDRALVENEQTRLQQVYDTLNQLDGFIDNPSTDTSQKIDDILYGEHGAWRGAIHEDKP